MTAVDELLLDTPAARPCTHKRPHAHGTLQRYRQDRCKCVPCREANTRYEQGRRAHVAAYGRWSAFADTRPVRAHVIDLMDSGLTRHAIADRAHISEDTVRRLLVSDTRRMARRTANALLALETSRTRPTDQGGLWAGIRPPESNTPDAWTKKEGA
jgi:AraC-like DNA-binding protein